MTTKEKLQLGPTLFVIGVIMMVLSIVLFVTGCAPTNEPTKIDSTTSLQTTETPIVDNTYAFGETAIYDDISVTLSQPFVYTPTELAAGVTEGNTALAVTFTLTNDSKKSFNSSFVVATAKSEGIFDVENSVGFPPSYDVAPGESITWTQAWSVADINAFLLEVTIGFTRPPVIFS